MVSVVQFVLSITVLAVIAQVDGEGIQNPVSRFFLGPRWKVNEALNNLREVVGKATNNAQETLKDAKIRAREAADDIRRKAKEHLQGFVDELKKKAKDGSGDIKNCPKAEKELTDLEDLLSKDMDRCISDNTNQRNKYVEDGLKQIKKIAERVESNEDEIKKCRGFGWLKCLIKWIVKLKEDNKALPEKIRADVADTVLSIDKLQVEMERCSLSKENRYQNDAKKIFDGISTCAKKKNEKTTTTPGSN